MLPTWSNLKNSSFNGNFMANVGWEVTNEGNPAIDFLYSEDNLNELSKAITYALQGVDKYNRKIIVSNDNIASVLSNVYRFGTRQSIGDIHSRFIIPQSQPRCDLRSINNQTINIIVSQIKNQTEMEENNKKLTVWSSLLGDFNKEGLRSHEPIKIRKKHPQYMAFNMNY